MEFDFTGFGPGVVAVHGIDAGDIEEREIGAFVNGAGSPCIGVELGLEGTPLPITGNNGIETTSFDLTWVQCLHVHLNGSGAIDNIEITTEGENTPVVEVTCPQDTLGVGESMTCTESTTATPGQYRNLETACGDGAGETVCDEDPSNHFGATQAITIEKLTKIDNCSNDTSASDHNEINLKNSSDDACGDHNNGGRHYDDD
jgi:hypothetical protein